MPSNSLLARHAVVALLGAALLTSCGLLRSAASTVVPGEKTPGSTVDEQLTDLMRYSDLIAFRMEEATRQFEAAAGTHEAVLEGARMRLETLRWTTQLATGPNPIAGLLDLIVLAATMRWMHEDETIPKRWGEAARPLWIVMKTTEDDGWSLLERHLPKEQVAEARTLLADWRTENPQLQRADLLQFPGFRTVAGEDKAASSKSSLLGVVGLDPLSGLEPTVRQIEQTRQLGQRALFFAQRAPRLISAEIELRMLTAREAPELKQLLRDTERVTATLESVAATAASLPEAVSREREAALKQVSEELSAQRAGLLADVAEARAPLESLMKETQATLTAARSLSGELTGTVLAVDAFLARWDEPPAPPGSEPPAAAPPPEPSEPEVPGKPFDIVEYGDTAERVGHAVAELHALVAELDQRMPEAQALLDEAAAHGKSTIDHVLLRVAEVGLALIAAAACATWLLRRGGRSVRPG